MAEEHEAHPARTDRVLWPWISLIPGGVGAWAPIYAGARARRVAWVVWGVVWTLLVIAGWVGVGFTKPDSGPATVAVLAIIVGWIGAVATSFGLRNPYRAAIGS